MVLKNGEASGLSYVTIKNPVEHALDEKTDSTFTVSPPPTINQNLVAMKL